MYNPKKDMNVFYVKMIFFVTFWYGLIITMAYFENNTRYEKSAMIVLSLIVWFLNVLWILIAIIKNNRKH